MTVTQSLASFVLAAGLLTVTPGLDTALVLRTAATEGVLRAVLAALGVAAGCLLWGGAVAVGLGALFAVSEAAYTALKWAGAAYLLWLGLRMICRPKTQFPVAPAAGSLDPVGRAGWFRRGALQNLLNPKVGVFYVSFLPQFVPPTMPASGYTFLLATVHAILTVAWFAALVAATRPLVRALRSPRVLGAVDRATGCVFVAFGARLALSER